MRRITFGTLVALGVILVGSAFTQMSAAAPKAFAVAGGSQTTSDGTKTFALSAHAGPHGASGYVVMTQTSNCCGPFRLQGHVSCVAVSGNRATIGVEIEHGEGTAEAQTGILLFVEDNGNRPSDPPDEFTNSGYVNDPSVCPAPNDPTTPMTTPITSGNINVKDS